MGLDDYKKSFRRAFDLIEKHKNTLNFDAIAEDICKGVVSELDKDFNILIVNALERRYTHKNKD